MKVLIVDDNFNDRTGVNDLVHWSKFGVSEVFCATNGQEGYEMAKEIQPTLVLTDVAMPIMNGIKMAKKILSLYPQTKFIFFSCFDDVEYLTAAIETRAYGYLLKPIDIDLLEQTIEKVLKTEKLEQEQCEEISTLKNRLQEYTPVVRIALLRDFLTGSVQKIENKEILDFYKRGYFSVAILYIDESDESYAQIYEINDLLTRFFIGEKKIFSFVMGSTYLVMVTNWQGEVNENEKLDNAIDFFQEIRDVFEREYKVKVKVCIGGVTDNFKQLPVLFHRCESAFKSGNVYSGITFSDKVGKQLSGFDYDLSELQNHITRIVDFTDVDDLDWFIEEYYSEQGLDISNSNHVISFVVLSILQMVLSEKNVGFSDIFGDSNLIWNKLQNYKSICDVKNWMYNIFKSIIEYMKQQNSNSTNHSIVVAQIKKIISENICDIENISQITKKLYISTSYANSIFKEHEGKTIFEYLNEIKIDMAKKMLKNSELKIYEIAERLGYKTNSYFGVVFKDKVGMTPKKYRDTYGIKKE